MTVTTDCKWDDAAELRRSVIYDRVAGNPVARQRGYGQSFAILLVASNLKEFRHGQSDLDLGKAERR